MLKIVIQYVLLLLLLLSLLLPLILTIMLLIRCYWVISLGKKNTSSLIGEMTKGRWMYVPGVNHIGASLDNQSNSRSLSQNMIMFRKENEKLWSDSFLLCSWIWTDYNVENTNGFYSNQQKCYLKVAEHSFCYLCFIRLFLWNPSSFDHQNWHKAI